MSNAYEQRPGLALGSRPGRLLAVDDDFFISDIIARAAREEGMEAETVCDAASLTPERLANFDVVTLDLNMPGMDGIEMLRLLSRADPAPVIVLVSGLDQRMLDSVRQLAKARGLHVCSILRKPFPISELRDTFARLSGCAARQLRPAPPAEPGLSVSPGELREAIQRREFEVHYQPQFSTRDQQWLGVEALARWRHPTRGLLFPKTFLALVEDPLLSMPFTETILDIALGDLRTLDQAKFCGTLAVNLPPTALRDFSIPERILERLSRLGVAASRLVIEVTETSLPEDLAVSLDILARLRMRGVHLSIDDFGTGHSGLSRLRDSPFDELKIDMDFIRNAEDHGASREIVRNAIRLGHSFNMRVVAEGVESQNTLTWLRAEGCDLVQGFHFSPALALPGLVAWACGRG